jgi:hypothetical protein
MMPALVCFLIICAQTVPEPSKPCPPGIASIVPYPMEEKEKGHFIGLPREPITIAPGATLSVQCRRGEG